MEAPFLLLQLGHPGSHLAATFVCVEMRNLPESGALASQHPLGRLQTIIYIEKNINIQWWQVGWCISQFSHHWDKMADPTTER